MLKSWVIALCLAGTLVAQDDATPFTGTWEGEIQGARLRVIIEIAHDAAGFRGTIDIPQQAIEKQALENFSLKDGVLKFTIAGIPGQPTFAGTLNGAGTMMSGPFTQGGASLHFSLARPKAVADRHSKALAEFEVWVPSAMEALEVPGCSVVAVKDGKILLARGFGYRDRDRKLAATEKTLFPIGSTTKAFTTFALALAAEDGRFDWDEPVVRYLPAFRVADDYISFHATTRDLCAHRTGMPRHDLVWYGGGDWRLDRTTLPARLATLEMTDGLRERYQYNNLMYAVAGEVLAKVDAMSWEDAIRKRILDPLGMSRTVLDLEAMFQDGDYSLGYGRQKGKIEALPFRDTSGIGPAGSICSSAEDLAAWLIVQLGGAAKNGEPPLRGSALKDLHRPHISMGGLPADPGATAPSYGLGWVIDGHGGLQRLQHDGGIGGFLAQIQIYPTEGLGIAVLTNRTGLAFHSLAANHLASCLLDLKQDDGVQAALTAERARTKMEEVDQSGELEERREGARPVRPLLEYTGRYVHEAYGEVHVRLEGDRLVVSFHGFRAPLEHWHFEVFRALADAADPTIEGTMIQFETDFSGDPVALRVALEPRAKPIRFEARAGDDLKTPEYLDPFTGTFQLGPQQAVFTREGDHLVVDLPGQPRWTLRPERRNSFRLQEMEGFSVKFTQNEAGQVHKAVFRQPNGVFAGHRVTKEN
ncbi:MAG: serine hydrolase [Planctomycetes bacterium]|nr:serine hydrolase [Planctomycetota bacterium]